MRLLAFALCLIGTTAAAMPREKCVMALADAYAMESALSEIIDKATRTTRIYARENGPGIKAPADAANMIEESVLASVAAYQDAMFDLCKKT